jgi:hypothetical protein
MMNVKGFIGPLPLSTQSNAPEKKSTLASGGGGQPQPISRSSPLSFLSLLRGPPVVPLSPVGASSSSSRLTSHAAVNSSFAKYKSCLSKSDCLHHSPPRCDASSLTPPRTLFSSGSGCNSVSRRVQLNHSSTGAFERFVKKAPLCSKLFQVQSRNKGNAGSISKGPSPKKRNASSVASSQSPSMEAVKLRYSEKGCKTKLKESLDEAGLNVLGDEIQAMDIEGKVSSIVIHRRSTSGDTIESSLTDHHEHEDEIGQDTAVQESVPAVLQRSSNPVQREGEASVISPSLSNGGDWSGRQSNGFAIRRRHTFVSPSTRFEDLEVLETNRRGAKLRRRSEAPMRSDGTSSGTSFELQTCASPATVREGATLAVDRWFDSAIARGSVSSSYTKDNEFMAGTGELTKEVPLSPKTMFVLSPPATLSGGARSPLSSVVHGLIPTKPSVRRVLHFTRQQENRFV